MAKLSIHQNDSYIQENRPLGKVTDRQKAMIDSFLDEYPYVTPKHVNAYFQSSYALHYYIYITNNIETQNDMLVITRCEHKHTAFDKVMGIRAYVKEKIAARPDASAQGTGVDGE